MKRERPAARTGILRALVTFPLSLVLVIAGWTSVAAVQTEVVIP